MASAGTICQGAKLKIKHIPLKAICKNCHKKFNFEKIEQALSEGYCNAVAAASLKLANRTTQVEKSWARVILGPFPTSQAGNHSIVVAVD